MSEQTSPQPRDVIRPFFDAIKDLACTLADRWRDESEYEDIEEYRTVLQAAATPLGATITRMHRRPFGFLFTLPGLAEPWVLKVMANRIRCEPSSRRFPPKGSLGPKNQKPSQQWVAPFFDALKDRLSVARLQSSGFVNPDLTSYQRALQELAAPHKVTITRMTRRPFGFAFSREGVTGRMFVRGGRICIEPTR